jgi:hypothetical protein
MKKRSHHKQIDRKSRRKSRSSITGARHMIARSIFVPPISESIAEAQHRVQSLFDRGGDVSLEELQGAVEYLLDKVKAARGPNG